MKRLFCIIIACFIATVSFAQGFTIEVDGPRVVAVGESFRIEFSMNGKPDDFTAPTFENFELVAGPSVSQSSSFSMINGKTTQKSSYTYSYVLVAIKKGNFTIGTAEAKKENKFYRSEPFPIEVVDEGAATNKAGNGGNRGGTSSGSGSSETTVSKDDILLVMEVDKTSVYKGEAISAKVKLLSRAQIVGLEGAKTPSFAGFWQQELTNEDRQVEWKRINYNNSIYDAATIKEFLLYPQQNGTIKIDPMTLNVVVRVPDASAGSSNSIFDSFFGGGGRYRDIRKVISTKAINITIKPYPTAQPATFSGAVGEFQMQSTLSNDMISANSAANIIVTIKGNGNLPLITEPITELPSSFELYKVKTEESTNVTGNGVTGSKTFTYPFIARAQGDYKLNPIEFTYFSPSKGQFVTLKSEAFAIAVSADNSIGGASGTTEIITGVSKEELKILGKDIGYIMTAVPTLQLKGEFLIWSSTHFLIILALIVLCFVILILLRRMINEAKDTVKVKSKRANRVALNRLKEAKRSLDHSDSAAFYEAVLKAMWGYATDKLNIDNASLSREKVAEKLTAKGVDSQQQEQFFSVLSSCEEARYSPIASSMMGEVYNTAIEVITKFENKR